MDSSGRKQSVREREYVGVEMGNSYLEEPGRRGGGGYNMSDGRGMMAHLGVVFICGIAHFPSSNTYTHIYIYIYLYVLVICSVRTWSFDEAEEEPRFRINDVIVEEPPQECVKAVK